MRQALAVPALAFLLAACAGASSEATCGACGDCTASIRFHGVLYVTDSRVDQSAPKGAVLGSGSAVDCDHRTVLEGAVIVGVKGVDPTQAIRVRGKYHGVYVAEGLPRADWARVLRTH